VGLEQLANVGVVTFFDGCAVAIAGVVDQDVDGAELVLGLINGVGDLGGVGDVERECENAVHVPVGEVGDFRYVASSDDRVVTCGMDGLR